MVGKRKIYSFKSKVLSELEFATVSGQIPKWKPHHLPSNLSEIMANRLSSNCPEYQVLVLKVAKNSKP